jgi:hypothetical protein
MRVFENRVLRRVFGPKRDKVTGYYILKLRSSKVFRTYANVIRVYVSMLMSYEYFLSVLPPDIQEVFFLVPSFVW